jgi:hypothetical protein
MSDDYYYEDPTRRLKVWLTALTLAMVALLFGQIWQFFGSGGGRSAACSPDGAECFDSGYQPVSNAASTTFYFKHRLGAPPRFVELWFSPTQDGERAYLAAWRFPRIEAGNPVSIEARSDAVYVGVWSGQPIHGVYNPVTDKWQTFAQGFYRVVAYK